MLEPDLRDQIKEMMVENLMLKVPKEEIADENAGGVSPHHSGRRLAAAKVAAIDDIVMEEGGRVHELDAGGEIDVAVALVAAHPRGREREHRPQPLPSR